MISRTFVSSRVSVLFINKSNNEYYLKNIKKLKKLCNIQFPKIEITLNYLKLLIITTF